VRLTQPRGQEAADSRATATTRKHLFSRGVGRHGVNGVAVEDPEGLVGSAGLGEAPEGCAAGILHDVKEQVGELAIAAPAMFWRRAYVSTGAQSQGGSGPV
jgi:hypothetical protein